MKKESYPHRKDTLHLLPLALLFFGLATCAPSLRAQTAPQVINYQGKLVDAAGNPLPDGAYELVFRVWDQADSNDPRQRLIWGQTNQVSGIKGIFNVILGGPGGGLIRGTVATNLASTFTEAERYLGITINRNPSGPVNVPAEIRPRQQILSAPYALQAERAASAKLADAATTVIQSPIPKGLIAMWGGGSTNAIPQGWALCDGQNGTPDLRDRFVIGAGTNRIVGAIGGLVSHNHSASITTERPTDDYFAAAGWNNPDSGPSGAMVTAAGHLHTVTIQAADHLPPYYALAFIIKL